MATLVSFSTRLPHEKYSYMVVPFWKLVVYFTFSHYYGVLTPLNQWCKNSPSVAHVGYDISHLSRVKFKI
jgi:hypothetical protein